ncbi:E3 ubiquitin-protein ligase PDZRN3-like [Amblyomma americanum]
MRVIAPPPQFVRERGVEKTPNVMRSESVAYKLVGFAPQLDWKPLHFVRPIPSDRVCSACGLVRRMAASLPCAHVLCQSCYGQCARDGAHVCPLDGLKCADEIINWKELPAEELLEREVRCWNQVNGCSAVMAAGDLPRHFQRECGHHAVRCPLCSSRVLCRDVVAHLRSDCGSPTRPLGS